MDDAHPTLRIYEFREKQNGLADLLRHPARLDYLAEQRGLTSAQFKDIILQEMVDLQHRESVQAAALLEAQTNGGGEQHPEAGSRGALGSGTRHAPEDSEPDEQGAESASEGTLHAEGEDDEDEVPFVEDGWGYPDDIEYM